jgi:ribosome-binding protein aMBF1 (putative translation factor)
MPTAPKTTYVHPVTAYRHRHGLSLNQLGQRCDPPIDKSVLHRIETGQRKPNFDQLKALVAACGYEFTSDDIIAATPKSVAA